MLRFMLPISAMLAACTPTPQKDSMPSPKTPRGSITPPTSAPEAPATTLSDSPAEAKGRRILSTAFVRIGPDGHLTVELRSGQVLVLRDVAMRPKDYCGVQVAVASRPAKYCGGYADVTAARPGGAPVTKVPDDLVGVPIEPAQDSNKGN